MISRSGHLTCLLVAFLASMSAWPGAARPGGSGDIPPGSALPKLPPISKECGPLARGSLRLAPLPNSMHSLRERKLIRILAIGGPSVTSDLAGVTDDQEKLQGEMERAVKGLKVEIINRGISGEIVRDAAERLKNEVALNAPDLVLWRVGTSDALARIPLGEFEAALIENVRWLKARGIDVVLVGAKFSRPLADDTGYQAIRQSVFNVAAQENVLSISQWQAGEALEEARGGPSAPLDEIELSEETYDCVAEYVARAVVSTLFDLRPVPAQTP